MKLSSPNDFGTNGFLKFRLDSNSIIQKQAKYNFPFYPYGLSLNAYWKTGTQLLQRSLSHALLLDLDYTIKMYKKSINIYSPRLDSNLLTFIGIDAILRENLPEPWQKGRIFLISKIKNPESFNSSMLVMYKKFALGTDQGPSLGTISKSSLIFNSIAGHTWHTTLVTLKPLILEIF